MAANGQNCGALRRKIFRSSNVVNQRSRNLIYSFACANSPLAPHSVGDRAKCQHRAQLTAETAQTRWANFDRALTKVKGKEREKKSRATWRFNFSPIFTRSVTYLTCLFARVTSSDVESERQLRMQIAASETRGGKESVVMRNMELSYT